MCYNFLYEKTGQRDQAYWLEHFRAGTRKMMRGGNDANNKKAAHTGTVWADFVIGETVFDKFWCASSFLNPSWTA